MTDPQPPYTADIPKRFKEVPYEDLPAGLKRRVDQGEEK